MTEEGTDRNRRHNSDKDSRNSGNDNKIAIKKRNLVLSVVVVVSLSVLLVASGPVSNFVLPLLYTDDSDAEAAAPESSSSSSPSSSSTMITTPSSPSSPSPASKSSPPSPTSPSAPPSSSKGSSSLAPSSSLPSSPSSSNPHSSSTPTSAAPISSSAGNSPTSSSSSSPDSTLSPPFSPTITSSSPGSNSKCSKQLTNCQERAEKLVDTQTASCQKKFQGDPGSLAICDAAAENSYIQHLDQCRLDFQHCDECPAGRTACGSECCTSSQTCESGVCKKCPSGQKSCGGTCTDTTTDVNNCGVCGLQCVGAGTGSGQTCQNGTCGCPSGTTLCGSLCVNTQTDSNNCSTCGNACPSGQSCTNGVCECPSGQTACGNPPVCIDLQTSISNCGACTTPTENHACASTQTCEAGLCKGCPSSQTNCGGTCTDTNTDNNNCGVCGVACPTALGKTCQSGMCQCPVGQQPDPITGQCQQQCPLGQHRDSVSGQCVCDPGLYRNPEDQCVSKCRDDNAVCSNIEPGTWACGPNGFFPDREVCCRTDISPPDRFACI
jgi:hypothetical protein